MMSVTEAGLAGMAAALRQFEQAGKQLVRTIAPDPNGTGGADAVNISEQAVELLRAERAFETSAKVVKAGAEIQKQLVNLLA